MKALIPANEAERLAVLKEYCILDTDREKSYDDLTALAAQICQVPTTMISLVDKNRQWFKSRLGVARRQTPRDVAFCARAILQPKPFIVRDARKDRRFARNPLVTGKPYIRFYAGFPLANPEGLILGTICVVDQIPRQLTVRQKKAMQTLARQVVSLLELRRISTRLAEALDRVQTLQGLLPICAWCKRIRDDAGYWAKVEAYFHERTGVDFTHGICPECMEKLRSEERRKKPAA
jgi:GAF domain-containing protein